MQVFLVALKYHDMLLMVLKSVEAMIPDDVQVSGAQKLDMALKSIIAIDSTLAGKEDALKGAFSALKTVYNAVRAALPAKG